MRSLGRGGAVLALGLALCLGHIGCGDEDNGTGPSELLLTCSVTPTSGTAPLTVSLSVTVAPGAAVQIQYGDGTSGNNPDAAHVYTVPGAYNLVVNARTDSLTASCQQAVTVAGPPPAPPNQPPIALFRVNPSPAIGPAPFLVAFNMCPTTDPDGDAMSFTFDFGDGQQRTQKLCRSDHVYARGIYTAETCVTDGVPGHESCREFRVEAQ
jgi:PKD repeat protein